MHHRLQKIVQFTSQKIEINYLYFLILFFWIGSLTLFHIFQDPTIQPKSFCFLYILLQTAFEIEVFILFAYLLKRFFSRIHSFIFSFVTILFLVHFVDFIMLRLLDTSIMYLFKFVFGEGLFHIFRVFVALNMNQTMIGMIIASILAVPIIGILLDLSLLQLTKKKPLYLSFNQIIQILGSTVCILFMFDFYAKSQLSIFSYKKFQKTLPLGTTFLSPHREKIVLDQPIKTPQEPNLTLSDPISKPNIYLFIIETLRKDFITKEIAPYLTSFAQENIQFPLSFSNANGTQHSWFSIFYSMLPCHWTYIHQEWKQGSPALQKLKQMGYKIHVYPSTDLCYFDMDQVLFGENRKLIDTIKEFPQVTHLESWQKDAICLENFQKDYLANHLKEGNLFIFFLDATHSEYSFPPPGKFHPIPKQIDYLTLTKQDIEPIKNRYRNACGYIDRLMNQFFQFLKSNQAYEDSCIMITGDHGEEFFEEGALFHGTHLNRFQTSVPIFFKFQNNNLPAHAKIATHIDIFPSLFQYLNVSLPERNGWSIFHPEPRNYWITFAQNGLETPQEFLLETDQFSLRARFLSSDIYKENTLEVVSWETDTELSPQEAIDSYFHQLFLH